MAFLTQIKTKMNRLVLTILGLTWILSLLREKSDLQQIQQESTNEKVLDVDCMALVDSVTKTDNISFTSPHLIPLTAGVVEDT